MATFSSVANTPAEDVKPPKPIPVGDYIFIVDGIPEFDSGVSQRTNEPFERYTVKCRPVSARETVDQMLLRDSLEGDKLNDRPINLAIFQPHAMVSLLAACGLKMGKKTIPQLIAELPGQQFQGHVSHNAGTRDKTMLYANIDSWAKAT